MTPSLDVEDLYGAMQRLDNLVRSIAPRMVGHTYRCRAWEPIEKSQEYIDADNKDRAKLLQDITADIEQLHLKIEASCEGLDI